MYKKFILIAVVCIVVLGSTSAFASLTLMTSGSQQAVYDSATDLYWFQSPGSFSQSAGTFPFGGSDLGSDISWYNTIGYFGITNWHLASSTEFDTMYLATPDQDIANSFDATKTTYGSETVTSGGFFGGIGGTICFPFGGCTTIGGSTSTTVNYSDTHWAGALADTQTVSGGFLGLSTTEILYADLIYRDYDANSVGLTDGYFLSGSYVPYKDFMGMNEPVDGAWVVGTKTGSPSGTIGVPEPASMLLLASGLIGLAGLRKRIS